MMIFNLSKVKYSVLDKNKGLILPKKVTPELAEETGIHIGDGSMNFYFNKNSYKGLYSLRGHISDDLNHYNNRIRYLYKKLYNLKPKLNKMPITGVYGFQQWSDCIVDFKHKILNLPLGNKINIKIPKCLNNKKELIINVLRGIFDTDGCVYLENKNKKLYPRIHIGTISHPLAEQLKKNISKLGFKTTIHKEIRTNKGWNDFYIISIRGDFMFKKWFKLIKPTNYKHKEKYKRYIKQCNKTVIFINKFPSNFIL